MSQSCWQSGLLGLDDPRELAVVAGHQRGVARLENSDDMCVQDVLHIGGGFFRVRFAATMARSSCKRATSSNIGAGRRELIHELGAPLRLVRERTLQSAHDIAVSAHVETPCLPVDRSEKVRGQMNGGAHGK